MATTVADVALDVVGARRRRRSRAAPRRAHASACSRGRRRSAARAPPENRAAEQYVERLEELGARVVEAAIPEPPDDTWPLFFHEAAESHRATFPARAAEYGENVRAKLEHAQTVEPDGGRAARDAVARGARTGPTVDLYVAPVLGVELPPVDCDELEVRIPLTAFLRPFNVLGWAALAIGDLQLVAPRDEVVLARALAWEQRSVDCYGRDVLDLARGRQRRVDRGAEVREARRRRRSRCPRRAVADEHAPHAAPRRRARSPRGTASPR